MLSPHGCEVKRQRLYATFLDLPQDVRLSILDFCTFHDIRTNVVRVSKECWIDCWRLKRTPNTACFTFEKMTDLCEMTDLLSFLDCRRSSMYAEKLTTLKILYPYYPYHSGCHQWDFKAASRRCQSTTFRFQHLIVKESSEQQTWEGPWKMGTVLHLMCKGSLPNLREISLTKCSFTSVEFCAITNSTPLVEAFSGCNIIVGHGALTGEEFGNWSKLKTLRLGGRMVLPKRRCHFLSSVMDRLEDVHVIGVSFRTRNKSDRVQDYLYQFGLAAPKLKRFFSNLEGNSKVRLQHQRPTLVLH